MDVKEKQTFGNLTWYIWWGDEENVKMSFFWTI